MRTASPFVLKTLWATVLLVVFGSRLVADDCNPRARASVSPGSYVQFEEALVVRLDASQSIAGFGLSCVDRGLSFRWSNAVDQPTRIVSPSDSETDVLVHETGLFSFLLEITDDDGNVDTAWASVAAVLDLESTCVPSAAITRPFEVLLPNGEAQTVSLSGIESKSGRSPVCDTLTLKSFRWEALDNAPAPQTPNEPTTSVTFEAPGEYSYRLTVESGDGDRAVDETTVLVRSFESPALIVRGDANADGGVDLGDGIFILNFLFTSNQHLPCANAANTDSTNGLDMADALRIFGWLFVDGPAPDPPISECGAPIGRLVNGVAQVDLGCENPRACLE